MKAATPQGLHKRVIIADDSSHDGAFALMSFQDRFNRELTSRSQKLEQDAYLAIVSAPVMHKYKPFRKFFEDAEQSVVATVHEFFQSLLDLATSLSAQSRGNESPLGWTKRHILKEVCKFLGVDQRLVEWSGFQNPQCRMSWHWGMSWHSDPEFDPTSEVEEDNHIQRSAERLARTEWLEDRNSCEFLLPRWTQAPHPALDLRHPKESPEERSAWDARFEAEQMSRAETMQWVKNTQVLLSTKIAIQIDSDISDAYLEAGKTGISILEAFTQPVSTNPARDAGMSAVASPRIETHAAQDLEASNHTGVSRAALIEKIRAEIVSISRVLELMEDYDDRIRGGKEPFVGFITVRVCDQNTNLCDKLCAIKTTRKPSIIALACEIASAFQANGNGKPVLPNTFRDAHKRHGKSARKLIGR